MVEIFERLAARNIQILPLTEIATHFVLERDGFAALVERRDNSFGKIGASGLLMERGLAQLLWRGGEAFFVAKGWERPASSGEVESLRSFAQDLRAALS
jgi:hypothetical protein